MKFWQKNDDKYIIKLARIQPALPVPVPREIALDKRLATLPDAQGHRIWAAQRGNEIIAEAKSALGGMMAKVTLPADSHVCVIPAFYTKPYGMSPGYNIQAFAQDTGRAKKATFPDNLPRAGREDPILLRSMAVAQLVPGFSHFRVTTDGSGNPKECLPMFVEPLKQGKLLVATDVGSVHDPKGRQSLLPAVIGKAPSLTALGLEEIAAPMLVVPDRVRRYVSQVAFMQRVMHEVFSHNFGREYAQATHSLGHHDFYRWWISVYGGRTITHNNLALYASVGGLYSEVAANSSGLLVGAETMAMHVSYMMRLATDSMAEYADVRQAVNDLPRGWEGLEAYLQQHFPDGLRKLHELDHKYGLAEALNTFTLCRGVQRDDPFNLPASCTEPLKRFYREVLGQDESAFMPKTPVAVAAEIYHSICSEAFDLKVPFPRLDEALKEAGVPKSTEFAPQTVIGEEIDRVEGRLGYWDVKTFLTNIHGTRPCDWVKLSIPYDPRLEKSVLNDACVNLGRLRGELFVDEFILRDDKGVSYWLYPEGLSKDAAKERHHLYRLDIVNEASDGKCLIMVHQGEERRKDVNMRVET